ncbi:hypothetical protein BF95_07855 [Sphingobium sp. Ant17]|nr:hypothetical protein BF95_07855 [Sphingobium sp. Ant17]
MGAEPVGELSKNLANDFSFRGIDAPLAMNRFAFAGEAPYDVVTKAKPAPGFAFLDAAAQTAMGLLRKILEKQRVHRALEADMQFRHFTLCQGNDLHTGELEILVKRGDVGLVARHPIQRLG